MINIHNIDNITRIFCEIDDFIKKFDKYLNAKAIKYEDIKKTNRTSRMSRSEIITILVIFQFCLLPFF